MAETPPRRPASAAPTEEPVTAPAIDAAILAELEAEDPDELGPLLAAFRDGANQVHTSLHQALADRRSGEVAALAHRLKSSARWIGAMRLGAICATLEQAGHQGRDGELAPLIATMDQELAAVLLYLDTRGTR